MPHGWCRGQGTGHGQRQPVGCAASPARAAHRALQTRRWLHAQACAASHTQFALLPSHCKRPHLPPSPAAATSAMTPRAAAGASPRTPRAAPEVETMSGAPRQVMGRRARRRRAPGSKTCRHRGHQLTPPRSLRLPPPAGPSHKQPSATTATPLADGIAALQRKEAAAAAGTSSPLSPTGRPWTSFALFALPRGTEAEGWVIPCSSSSRHPCVYRALTAAEDDAAACPASAASADLEAEAVSFAVHLAAVAEGAAASTDLELSAEEVRSPARAHGAGCVLRCAWPLLCAAAALARTAPHRLLTFLPAAPVPGAAARPRRQLLHRPCHCAQAARPRRARPAPLRQPAGPPRLHGRAAPRGLTAAAQPAPCNLGTGRLLASPTCFDRLPSPFNCHTLPIESTAASPLVPQQRGFTGVRCAEGGQRSTGVCVCGGGERTSVREGEACARARLE